MRKASNCFIIVFLSFLFFGGCSITELFTTTTTTTEATTSAPRVVKVEAGGRQTAILLDNGDLYAAGYNLDGILGIGANTNVLKFIKIFSGAKDMAFSQSSLLVLDNDGALWGTGDNSFGQLAQGTMSSTNRFVLVEIGVAKIAASGMSRSSYIIKNNGDFAYFGSDVAGEAGTGFYQNKITFVYTLYEISGGVFVEGGVYDSFVIKSDGSLWSTGFNDHGQLGIATNYYLTNRYVQSFSGVESVSGGAYHTVALRRDGSLWATGYSGNGQIGDGISGSSAYVFGFKKVMSGVASAACGYEYTVALKTDGTVWGTGLNIDNYYGDGPWMTNRYYQIFDNAAQVSACNVHTVILKTDGTVWASGINTYGQFGIGAAFPKTNIFIRIY